MKKQLSLFFLEVGVNQVKQIKSILHDFFY